MPKTSATTKGGGAGSSTFLGLTDTPSSYTGQALKVARVNAGETAIEFATLAGGGDALKADPLSQFAATTSLQLKGVISDETGSGALVFGTSPNITTPTGIVKGDVGLGNVVNADTTTTANITDSLNKRFITDAQQTVLGNTSNTNTGDNATNSQYSGLDTSKENTITGTTSADFWSGAKTFINFATTVRGTVLTGLSLVTSQVIAATDSVLLALGYLQAQITALTTVVSGKVATTLTISTTAPLSGGGDLSADRTLTTSMATNKLIGRGTAGTGVMEEITLGTNLSFTGTTLNATGGGGGTPATTVVSETTAGQSSAVGVSTNYAREDHTHGTPAGGAGGDIAMSNLAPSANEVITAGYGAYVPWYYEVVSTFSTEIGLGGILEIG